MQIRMESRALGSSNAMIGPEHMFPKTRLKQVERNSSLMVGSEGMMITRVPILGQNCMAKGARDAMDHRHHFLTARYREGAPIAKVILYVDHQQNIAICNFHGHLLETIALFCYPKQPLKVRPRKHVARFALWKQ